MSQITYNNNCTLQQAKLSDYRKHGGTGLGLSISKKLIDGMRGSLRVESEEGRGSCFTVYIPVGVELNPPIVSRVFESSQALQEDDQPLSPLTKELRSRASNDTLCFLKSPSPTLFSSNTSYLTPKTAAPALTIARSNMSPSAPTSQTQERFLLEAFDASTPTSSFGDRDEPLVSPHPSALDDVILVVDDNVMNLKLLGRMFNHYKLEYRTANNGQEAVDAFLESRNVNPQKTDAPYYALVFMDWQMPVMDGREATEILRKKLQINVPIIALTANVAQKHKDEALEAGASEFATKPILRDELFKKCQRYLPSLQK